MKTSLANKIKKHFTKSSFGLTTLVAGNINCGSSPQFSGPPDIRDTWPSISQEGDPNELPPELYPYRAPTAEQCREIFEEYSKWNASLNKQATLEDIWRAYANKDNEALANIAIAYTAQYTGIIELTNAIEWTNEIFLAVGGCTYGYEEENDSGYVEPDNIGTISDGTITGINGWEVSAYIDMNPNSGSYGTPVTVNITFSRGGQYVDAIETYQAAISTECDFVRDPTVDPLYKKTNIWETEEGVVLTGIEGIVRYYAINDGERIAIGDVDVNGGCDSGPFKIIKSKEPKAYTILEPVIKKR